MSLTKVLLLLFVFFISTKSFSQPGAPASTWATFDTSILYKRNLLDIWQEIEKIKKSALKENEPVLVGKCFYYQMVIDDLRTEDTSYFKNSAFIDSILTASNSPQLQAVMHLMQARRLAVFFQDFFTRSNRNLFRNKSGGTEYCNLSAKELDSLIMQHFEAAKTLAPALKNNTIEALAWLSNDPLMFLFKPSFLDVAFANQLEYLQNGSKDYNQPKNNSWLLLSPDALMQLPDSSVLFSKNEHFLLTVYQQWANHYAATQPNVYCFIETLARKYFYNSKASGDSTAEKYYLRYLEKQSQSAYTEVKANAVYQLCLLYNKMGSRYNNAGIRNFRDFDYIGGKTIFDTAYRMYYVKALKLLEQNEQMLDSFGFMKNVLLAMRGKIKSPQVKIVAESNHLPGENIPAFLKFRNTGQVHTRIIRLHTFERLPQYTDDIIKYLSQKTGFASKSFIITPFNDYQYHQSFIKFDALPAGKYAVLYSNQNLDTVDDKVEYLLLTVTNMVIVNNDEKVFLLNRKTGFPIKDAQVTINRFIQKKLNDSTSFTAIVASPPQKINNDGYITVKGDNVESITAINGNDTISSAINKPDEEDLPEEIYTKDEYDDMLEYYEDNTKLHLYTDRAIYRPGQTVYFKGILITHHPKTGEQLVLNWKNIKVPFFKKIIYKLVAKFEKLNLRLDLKDPFNRTVDSIKIKPNKYGSVAGSFTIPKNAATGDWDFEIDDSDFDFILDIDDDNDGTFKVEEYKRPSFEITIEKPRQVLQLGDSFSVKVKLRSFAGASLNNALIKYSIERNGNLPSLDKHSGDVKRVYSSENLIIDSNVYTNDKGEYEIHISDTLLAKLPFNNSEEWTADYRIEVEAIDATGESHEQSANLLMTSRPIKIDVPIGKTVDRSALKPLYISTTHKLAGPIKKQVSIKLYKLAGKDAAGKESIWPEPDIWLYPQGELKTWFPQLMLEKTAPQEALLIYETSIMTTGDEKLSLPYDIMVAGNYKLVSECNEGGKLLGTTTKLFAVFDKENRLLPDSGSSFSYMPFNSVAAGENIQWYTGNSKQDIFSIYHLSYYAKTKKGIRRKNLYDIKPERKGINGWQFPMPADAVDEVAITHLYIVNNELHKDFERVFVALTQASKPEIIVEQYRTKLAPGSSTNFSVSIKTKNANTAAELMTTMYDASLDKIEKHEWRMPSQRRLKNINTKWPYRISETPSFNWTVSYSDEYFDYEVKPKPMWFINPLMYNYANMRFASNKFTFQHDMNPDVRYNAGYDRFSSTLMGSVPGLSILNTNGLDDVVTIGYGTQRKQNLTGAVSKIVVRGISTLSAYTSMLVIIDGVVYQGDISKIDLATITEGITLKGADATAIYGSRAANGILLLSTKGPVQIPDIPAEPPMVIRKNFNETAFFYPQVHADRNGFYNISFTMPESITEWKWKMLAHTKKAVFSYAEKSIFTQLPLMVQPNMPRFLSQGDRLVLKSRISNLDTSAMAGNANCIIEDVVTGQDITSVISKTLKQSFSLAAKANTAVAFELNIPNNFLHPLRIKITASAGGFADGEEHIIPILSKKILVSQQVPFVVTGNSDTAIKTPMLPADAEAFGVGLHIAPKPQSAMLDALPYLAFYPYGCAEQTFNKLYAYSVAISIMRTDTAAQNAFKSFSAINEALTKQPDELDEETMPWLQLGHSHSLRQQRLTRLLDTLQGRQMIEKYFGILQELQTSDGGVSWFKGGESSPYISAYILSAFGKLEKNKLPFLVNEQLKQRYAALLPKLLEYNDQQFLRPASAISFSNPVFYLYARSFWQEKYKPSAGLQLKIDSALGKLWKDVAVFNLNKQAMLVLVSLRHGGAFAEIATKQLRSIQQLAIADNKNGIRWKDIADSDDLNTLGEETIVRLAEAFEEAGQSKETVDGIVKWLLQAKQEHEWGTTKATADAVGLLNRQKPVTTGVPNHLSVVIDQQKLRVTDNLFQGKLFDFLTGKQFPSEVKMEAGNKGMPVSGGIGYYYFTANPPVADNNAVVKISKQLQRFNAVTNSWEPVVENAVLHIADKLKTTININAARQLRYVFINDNRAAALEPADAISGYQWGTGFSYYKSVRDAGMQFFAESIPSGITSISYETVVAKEGIFYNGTTALQCMYQPGVKAYAGSIEFQVKDVDR